LKAPGTPRQEMFHVVCGVRERRGGVLLMVGVVWRAVEARRCVLRFVVLMLCGLCCQGGVEWCA
jgi:hypothetical protein